PSLIPRGNPRFHTPTSQLPSPPMTSERLPRKEVTHMRSNIIRNTGRALVVGAACLALAGSAASSASASGLVKLSPGSGAAGSSIKVSGSLLPLPHGGNIVSEQIGIYFDQKLEATSSTGAMGRF